MTTKSVTMGSATIGPQMWRSNTVNTIKLSQNIAQRSDRGCEMGKSMGPVPHLRDIVAELSNTEAHRHFRLTRIVVYQLREALLGINEEVKSLSRTAAALEKEVNQIRSSLKVNEASRNRRSLRPLREKEHDGADDLLHAEKMHLINWKRMLESNLSLVQQQLQALNSARKRLSDVTQERARVLDLVSHSLPSMSASAMPAMRRSKSFSHSALNGRTSAMPSQMEIDPLGAYTPEVDAALKEAKEAQDRSMTLRKDGADAIKKSENMQKAASKSVNQGLVQKMAETVTLKQHLKLSSGENRHALNRAKRYYDATEMAWANTRGPLSSSDLSSHEKLDRPIIKVFQRHPGNNMPEAQELVRSDAGLLESLTTTGRNIGLLRLAQLRLKEDISDKASALDIDGNVVRMRRCKANNRSSMGAAY